MPSDRLVHCLLFALVSLFNADTNGRREMTSPVKGHHFVIIAGNSYRRMRQPTTSLLESPLFVLDDVAERKNSVQDIRYMGDLAVTPLP